MLRRFTRPCFWLASILLLTPRPALALQPHGPPEGLYVHQMAHLLFAGALIFFIWSIRHEAMAKAPGFRRLTQACVLFILWNLLAFVGHWAEVVLDLEDFVGPAGDFGRRLVMSKAAAWIYYVAKFDHLMLVPAFFLLGRGLKALLPQTGQED
jgi:hypothetical protein